MKRNNSLALLGVGVGGSGSVTGKSSCSETSDSDSTGATVSSKACGREVIEEAGPIVSGVGKFPAA